MMSYYSKITWLYPHVVMNMLRMWKCFCGISFKSITSTQTMLHYEISTEDKSDPYIYNRNNSSLTGLRVGWKNWVSKSGNKLAYFLSSYQNWWPEYLGLLTEKNWITKKLDVCLNLGSPLSSVRVVVYSFALHHSVAGLLTASAAIITVMFSNSCGSWRSLLQVNLVAQTRVWKLTVVVLSANKANQSFIGRSR